MQNISRSFPGADDDSRPEATADLVRRVPAERTATRALLQETSRLPKSLKKGFFRPKEGWILPESYGTVRLDVTKDGYARDGHDIGPGTRQYDGGEEGTSTVLQQLPGKTMRIYKVVERHAGEPGSPTKLAFSFERGCSDSSGEERCSDGEQCTGGFFGIGETCQKPWVVSNRYTYVGHHGMMLIDPNRPSPATAEGTPVGFLTSPTARDATGRPVSVEWNLDGDSVEVSVADHPGVQYPVVVDPHWFVGGWLNRAALILANSPTVPRAPHIMLAMKALGCGAAGTLTWLEAEGQPWYDKVWKSVLGCLTVV